MGFHNIVLPSKFVGYTTVIGPGHRTIIQESRSGLEPNRAIRWPQGRRRFDITNEMNVGDAIELQEFVIARRGAQHSFLIKDLSDFSTNADHAGAVDDEDETIGTGDGSSTEFQLKKSYGTGSNPKTRIINKPIAGTVVIAVNTVAQTEGTDYAVDYQSGRISFLTGPANTLAVTAGFQFYAECRFSESVDEQFSMVWESEDVMKISAEAIEDRTAVAPGDRHEAWSGSVMFGGGRAISPSDTFRISTVFGDGRVLEFDAPVDINVRLPDVQETGFWTTYPSTTQVAEGGIYFVILNGHATTTLTLQERIDPGGGFVWRDLLSGSSVPPRRIREVFLDEAGIWRAR